MNTTDTSYRIAKLSPASVVLAVVVAWVAHPAATSVEDLALEAVEASAADTAVDLAWVAAPRSSSPT